MKKLLIFVDSTDNHNKFYLIQLEGDSVLVEYGRVGTSSQKKTYSGGQKTFDKKIKEKLKKGYVESSINLEAIEVSVNSNGNLMDIAMAQIKTDLEGKELIKKLVAQNIHNITSNSKISYDIKTGYFKTDLGIITQEGVDKAIGLLDEIKRIMEVFQYSVFTDDGNSTRKSFIKLNEEYFTIIPTKIKNLREFNNLLVNDEKIDAQRDICNALLDSIKIIEAEKQKINESDKPKVVQETIFDTSVTKLTDTEEFNRLVEYFEKSKNKNHNLDSYKIYNIYNLSIGRESEGYRKDLPNQMELFHGTKVANLLSILKSGLLMPKYSPGKTTGYMFGQGLYFASQSSKSLNYCDGMYWNNSAKQDRIYMFIADIAMGNYQIPSSSRSKMPDAGYDSYWAQPGKSGIMNDEMIVFNNNQIRLKYILEIGA